MGSSVTLKRSFLDQPLVVDFMDPQNQLGDREGELLVASLPPPSPKS